MAGLHGLRGLWWVSCARLCSHLGNLSILRANAVKIEEAVFPLEPWTIQPGVLDKSLSNENQILSHLCWAFQSATLTPSQVTTLHPVFLFRQCTTG